MLKTLILFLLFVITHSLKSAAQLSLKRNSDSTALQKPIMVLPQNFYNQHLGFFCKKESQVQQHTHLNLFVRLGSKQYVDYLERKPNAQKD